jgi:hypothetical protein
MHFDGRGLFNSKVDAYIMDTLTPFPKGPSLDLIHNLHLSDLFWVVLSFAGCTFARWIMPNKIKNHSYYGLQALLGSMDFAKSNPRPKNKQRCWPNFVLHFTQFSQYLGYITFDATSQTLLLPYPKVSLVIK